MFIYVNKQVTLEATANGIDTDTDVASDDTLGELLI